MTSQNPSTVGIEATESAVSPPYELVKGGIAKSSAALRLCRDNPPVQERAQPPP